ncbi:hypothetical protein [Bradyrhizobium sp. AS23.2]|uniref:hypothetical protein n=1 Tax=Bradyrhizobium sp. AS23.2 TaxID=1680155 RepID=UPI001160FBB5|nr:hypothetical protein [Bradyrhizobium sp. AS23.2]
MQRIIVSKNVTLDPIEKSLCLRYAEVLALREAVRKESSTLATKKPKRNGTNRVPVHVKRTLRSRTV